MKILLKTDLGIEHTTASRVRELDLSCTATPGNFRGIILVDRASPDVVPRLEQIPEITTILPIDAECPSHLPQIVEWAAEVARQKIDPGESFAVRTTRRDTQVFSSIDVNVAVGDAICQQVSSEVDLDFPDKAVYIEIIGGTTYIAVRPGVIELKKNRAGATGLEVTGRTAVIQQVYLDQSEASTSMGLNIGRAAQAFGVKELVLAIKEPAEARDLAHFVDGVINGRETRFKKSARITQGKTTRVPIYVADLYQTVRAREDEPIIVMTSLGNPFSSEREAIRRLYLQPRVNVLIGSTRGIPTGITRLADAALNLSPGITFATEHGIPAAITGIVSCLQE